LEVTESALASTSSFGALEDVHRIGVRTAIDDFGVGWSSMSRLSLFPWDLLKIDRTFVAPLGETDSAQHVVQGIISLAHSLGMRTSAEGVETVEQLHRLRDLGCDIAQGYLIDRPLPASEASRKMTLLARGDRSTNAIGWSASAISAIHGARSASSNAA